MTKAGIETVLREIEKFERAAEAVMKDPLHGESTSGLLFASASTGALRRASMDLTRALAKMRRM